MPLKKSKQTKKTPAQYEALGRSLVEIYESGYLDKKQSLKNSFIKGVVGGLGGVIGATVVVALLIWLLSFFKEIPLLSHFVQSIRHTLQTKQP